MFQLFKPSPEQLQQYEAERRKIMADMETSAPDQRTKSLRQLIRLSGKGLASASFDAAQYYAKLSAHGQPGDEKEKSRDNAKKYLFLYAKQGTPLDQYRAGCILESGDLDFPKDENLAFKCYRMSANGGHAEALINLGRCYFYALGVERNYDTAMGLYLQAAEKGQPRAWLNLGLMYQDGKGVKVDLKKAEDYYQKAVDQACELHFRNVYADANDYLERLHVLMLGELLRSGKEISREEEQDAINKLQTMANAGNYRAQFEMGLACTDGLYGVKQDYQEAMRWFKLCEPYLGGASYNIGFFYRNGLGVKKNLQIAIQYFIKSARASNHKCACDTLGDCYENGIGIAPDLVKAAEYYRRAAEQGVTRSMLRYAYFLENGIGVPKDAAAAEHWYKKAKNNS